MPHVQSSLSCSMTTTRRPWNAAARATYDNLHAHKVPHHRTTGPLDGLRFFFLAAACQQIRWHRSTPGICGAAACNIHELSRRHIQEASFSRPRTARPDLEWVEQHSRRADAAAKGHIGSRHHFCCHYAGQRLFG